MIDHVTDRIQGVTIPETAWGKQYAKLEYARVGLARTFSTRIEVKDVADLIVDRIRNSPHTRTLGQILDAGEQSFPHHDPYYGQDL